MNHSINCPLCQSAKPVLSGRRKDPARGLLLYLDCGDCGLVFLDRGNLLSEAEERERYDLHRNHAGDPGYVSFLDRIAVPLASRLAPGSRGLDFGCGPGPVLSGLMASRGFSMEQYDPLYYPDASVLSEPYGFITCTEVIEHFRKPAGDFALLDCLLAPRGYLGILTRIFYEDIVFEKWWYPSDPTHVSFYRERTLAWIAARYGWELEMPEKDMAIFRKL